MKTGTLVALGLGLGALYLAARGSASPTRTVTYTTSSGATVTVQTPNVSTADAQAAIAQRREAMIQRLMQVSHLTREQAEARYDQLVPAITAALTPTSGIGSYYRG